MALKGGGGQSIAYIEAEYLFPNGFANVSYNDWLVEPPRVYGESLSRILAVWRASFDLPPRQVEVVGGKPIPKMRDCAEKDGGAFAPPILMLALVDTIIWPGHNIVLYVVGESNPDKGRLSLFAGEDALPYKIGISSITQHVSIGIGGAMWAKNGGSYVLLDKDTFEATGTVYPSSHWKDEDGKQISPIGDIVDYMMFAGAYVIGSTRDNKVAEVSVFELGSGRTIFRIPVAGTVRQITPARAAGRCFVISHSGVITVLDYVNGVVLGALRQMPEDKISFHDILGTVWGWDGFKQKLLVSYHIPDDSDGACQSPTYGYWPTPVPVSLRTPIPLVAPRDGRTIPIVTRASGDTGESIGGWPVDGIVRELDDGDDDVAVVDTPARTGFAGYQRFDIPGDDVDAGDVFEVTVEAEAWNYAEWDL
jgi:hypothetical protein